MDNKTLYVYGLVDPRTRRLRYIGLSSNPKSRLYNHVSNARRSKGQFPKRLSSWLYELIQEGIAPEIVILEAGAEDDMIKAELRWIAAFRDSDDGICNAPTLHTDERRYPAFGLRIPSKRQQQSTSEEYLTGDELRAIRKKLSLSQSGLSELVGVHHSAVSLWESGKRRIPKSVALIVKQIEP